MRIVVIRHAEVDFRWSRWCSSKEFDLDCSGYDSAPIKDVTYSIPDISYSKVYISDKTRSRDTAKKLLPDREYIESELISEVPLRSGFDTKWKMPLWFWNILGRLQWLINSSRQLEGRSQTKKRAKHFIEGISKEDMDCAVITHGFYMHTLLKELKNAGFRISNSSVGYKNGEYVIAKK